MIVGELVFCIAIGIFTVFIVSIISILLVIAELVLMMFPDLRVPWTITDNFLWEIEEDIYQNEIKKRRGNNDSKWIQLFAVQIFKEIEETDLDIVREVLDAAKDKLNK